MTERQTVMQEVWDWIRTDKRSLEPNGFAAQDIRGSDYPEVLDALWALVAGNILRPNAPSQRQFQLTGVGAESLNDEWSPYAGSEFVRKVRIDAPFIDPGAAGYLALAVDIILTAPQAAVALLRAGLELEIDSFIGAYPATGQAKRLCYWYW